MKEIYKKKTKENIQSFKEDIRLFLKQEGLVIQETDEAEDSTQWVYQVKKESKLTLGVGSKATTITIDDFSDDTIKISVGQEWLSKLQGRHDNLVLSFVFVDWCSCSYRHFWTSKINQQDT